MRKLPKLNFHFFKELPAHEKRLTLPTLLTIARIVLVPFIVGAMVMQYWGLAFCLFIVSSLTDMLDGTFARLFDQQTFLGACLDPIADKLLLLSVFTALAFVQSPLFSIPLWFVILVLIRESIIVFGALIILLVKGDLAVRPTLLGKMTTVAEILFIVWLFACYFFQWLPIKTYYTMLGVLLILVFCSLLQYVRSGVAQIRMVL